MLSYLHTPPSSPSTVKASPASTSPVYNPPTVKTERYTKGFWDIGSPDSETDCVKNNKRPLTELTRADNKRPLTENTAPNKRPKVDNEAEQYKECKKLFKSQEDVTEVMSLLRKRKNLDIKEYSHEGMFIPNILLALSQTPRFDGPTPTDASSAVKVESEKDSRPYQCEYCGKRFTNIGNLATHARTHTKEKPYKCSKCDLEFAHTSNLQRHQLVHSGQRNNKCPYCDKCFSRSDYLKVHERTHTGEKPYACTVAGCAKRFLDSSSLKKHERTHTGLRPFSCHICDKSFSEASKLKTHLTQHDETKSCNICPETFTRPAELRRHLRTHAKHSVKPVVKTQRAQYSFHPYAQQQPQSTFTQQLAQQQVSLGNHQQQVTLQNHQQLTMTHQQQLFHQQQMMMAAKAHSQYMLPFPTQQKMNQRPSPAAQTPHRPSPQRPSPQRLVPAPTPQAPAVRHSPQATPTNAAIKAERVKPQTTSPHNTLVSSLPTISPATPASSVTTIMGQGGIPIYPKTKTIQRPLATRPVPYPRVVPTNAVPSNQSPSNARFITSSTINMTSQITVSTRCSAFLPVQYDMAC